jgi:D-alanyl-D-alanine carboxypeptidase
MTGRIARGLRLVKPAVAISSFAIWGALSLAQPADARADDHRAPPKRHNIIAAPSRNTAPASGFGPTAPGMSAILIDARSGAVMSEIGADIPRYPASLTKLMTLDLAFQALRDGRITLDTPVPVSDHAASVQPVKLGLQPGDTITVRQAILSMTTMSANDAATALGEFLGGGSEYRCGQMMTLRAHALGMAQTQFYNASGLPNPNQVSTARDLAILARDIVVSFPQDQPFFEVQKFDLDGRTIYSNNAMLKIYPGATGMKTGYTTLAKHNLITSAERNGHTLIGVVLHEPSWGSTYAQMTALLDNGFGTSMTASNLAPVTAPPAPAATKAQAGKAQASMRTASAAAGHAKQKAQPIQLAGNQTVTRDMIPGWTASLGTFTKMSAARVRAIKVQQMRGTGIARIAQVKSHGHVVWSAQLAGLTHNAAHATCSALAAHGSACTIIPPQADHLAERAQGNG